MLYQGSAAACNRPDSCRVRSNPAHGCSAWERAPGTDDEAGPPADGLGKTVRRSLKAQQQTPAALPVEWAP